MGIRVTTNGGKFWPGVGQWCASYKALECGPRRSSKNSALFLRCDINRVPGAHQQGFDLPPVGLDSQPVAGFISNPHRFLAVTRIFDEALRPAVVDRGHSLSQTSLQ